MTDYLPPLGWKPSPNFNSRGGCKIDQITVHDMEGYQRPSEELFEETSSHVSAHYTVSADGSTIDLMVAEANRAWHACDFNSRSIGIEMEGFSKSGFPDIERLTTARLVAHLCHKYSIPIQYAKGGVGPGIVSHWSYGRAGGGHSDPEPNDQWMIDFVALVKQETDAGRFPIDYEVSSESNIAPKPGEHDLSTTLGVQNALKSLMFDIQIDGQIGPETESVVGSFQVIAAVPGVHKGAIDDATRAAIAKALTGA